MRRNSINEVVISIMTVVILAGGMVGCEGLTFSKEGTGTNQEEIPAITQQDLDRGWYWGNEDQKKPGTPDDWIHTGDGTRSACWHEPEVASGVQTPRGNSQQNGTLHQIRLPTAASRVKVIEALPLGESGAEIKGEPEFITIETVNKHGFVTVEIGDEPVWIVEGDLPKTKNLNPERSPFGFHPASAYEVGYQYAQEIGVDWDRGGLYLMWVLVQPDVTSEQYNWDRFDTYFRNLPARMMTLKNITVAHDGMVERPGRHQGFPGTGDKPSVDVSQHLEGTTYRPADTELYSRWVKAVVERYDGDGKEDMPGLETPAKYWQVDNEPPRGREGYPDLVRITHKAIKEADPEARVLVGGLVPPYGERVKRYERNSLPILQELNGQSIDIVDLHWFAFAGEWRLIPEAIARVRRDLETCGFGDIPIWFAEMGTYSGKPDGWGGKEFPVQSERVQASEMLKCNTVALGEGVEKIFWAWGMREGFKDVEDNDFFDNTGFVYNGIGPGDPGEGIKKVIYWTYQEMTQLLQYWDGTKPVKIEAGEEVVAYRFPFGTDDGRGIVIVWLND